MDGHEVRPGRKRLRLRLAPDANAPAAARRALRRLPLGEREEDVLLLASELVTNAVVHARPPHGEPIELEATCDGGRARVEVRDKGPGFGRDTVLGHGLRMVEYVTERWGIEHNGSTRVWFELRA
jgi:anti-sigma regulatory factor (Ser/Thr protein kinase)